MNKLHIITAVAVIRRKDGRILLLKRSESETVYPGHFTFPGGKVEDNETIHEALAKEVYEECGLTLKPGIVLIKEKAIGRPDGQTSKSLSFLCSVEDNSAIKLDEKDFIEYKWVNLTELPILKHVGIEAEFKKVEQIVESEYSLDPFFVDTDKVDFRKNSSS
jgi:8-oxo-dGTP diphosphatase